MIYYRQKLPTHLHDLLTKSPLTARHLRYLGTIFFILALKASAVSVLNHLLTSHFIVSFKRVGSQIDRTLGMSSNGVMLPFEWVAKRD